MNGDHTADMPFLHFQLFDSFLRGIATCVGVVSTYMYSSG